MEIEYVYTSGSLFHREIANFTSGREASYNFDVATAPTTPAPSTPAPTPSCTGVSVNITAYTQGWGSEVGLKIDGEEAIKEGSMGDNEEKVLTRCLTVGAHTVVLTDSLSDGWHGVLG